MRYRPKVFGKLIDFLGPCSLNSVVKRKNCVPVAHESPVAR